MPGEKPICKKHADHLPPYIVRKSRKL